VRDGACREEVNESNDIVEKWRGHSVPSSVMTTGYLPKLSWARSDFVPESSEQRAVGREGRMPLQSTRIDATTVIACLRGRSNGLK
jgi:hypothetical protein